MEPRRWGGGITTSLDVLNQDCGRCPAESLHKANSLTALSPMREGIRQRKSKSKGVKTMTKIKVKADKLCGVEQIVPVHVIPSRERVLEALRLYPNSDYKAMIRASKQYRKADALLEDVE